MPGKLRVTTVTTTKHTPEKLEHAYLLTPGDRRVGRVDTGAFSFRLLAPVCAAYFSFLAAAWIAGRVSRRKATIPGSSSVVRLVGFAPLPELTRN